MTNFIASVARDLAPFRTKAILNICRKTPLSDRFPAVVSEIDAVTRAVERQDPEGATAHCKNLQVMSADFLRDIPTGTVCDFHTHVSR